MAATKYALGEGCLYTSEFWILFVHYTQTCTAQECPVLASYQMWFCQKLLKNAKNYTKIVKIWRFLSNFGPKIKIGQKTQKTQKLWILVLPEVDFTKIDYFTVIFGIFEQFLAKPHLVAC